MTHSPLLLQLLLILVTARVCGWLLRHVGQPGVIGEMVAGIVLGPIVLGALFPELHIALFPPASLPALSSLATLGVVLFMFIVGAELRAPDGVRAHAKAAGLVAVLGALLPIAMGLAIAPMLYRMLAPAGVGFWPFALFLAAALSITAFPVMARILKDRDMTHTRIGRLALGAAALSDVFAWIMLALVVALVGPDDCGAGFARIVLGLLALCAFVLVVLKPLYAWLLRRHAPDGRPSVLVLAMIMVGVFACAAVTEALHLHAVFGAFLFGACLPRDNRLLAWLVERIEPLAIVVLMPILFALAGLSTTADAFGSAGLGALAMILAVAVFGKIVGGAAGARAVGYHWRESLAVGALMNARGLMELIVLKVGLDAGLIGPELFTILLVIAILTTLMTGPLVTLCVGRRHGVVPAPGVGSLPD